MDINKIKERLAALRPEDLDPEDPEIGELLMLVEEDLELGEWFAQQQVFDQAFADKLQEIQPPEGLDQRIVEAMEKARDKGEDTPPVPQEPGKVEPEPEIQDATPAHLRETESTPKPENDPNATERVTPFEADVLAEQPAEVTPAAQETAHGSEQGTAVPFTPPPKRSWWQHPSIMSAAATIVLALAVIAIMFDGPRLSAKEVGDFYETIGKHHQSGAGVDLQSDSLESIRGYLHQHNAPVPGEMPPAIDPYPELGCSVIEWGGETVSVISMHDNEDVHVYVVRKSVFPDLSEGPQPRLHKLGQVVVLGWTDGDLHYFLVRTGDLNEIESLI